MLSRAQTNPHNLSSLRSFVTSAQEHSKEVSQGYQVSNWLSTKERHHRSLQTISYTQLKRLFTVLPTRGGDIYRSLPDLSLNPPNNGARIPLGSHLTILPDKYDNAPLRRDGLPCWHAPPPPFDYRRWVGGSFVFSAKTPPVVGMNFIAKTLSLHSKDLLHDPVYGDIIRVRQLSTVTQWHPEPTILVVEDREFHYHSDSFIPLEVGQFSTFPPDIERIPCFDFNISQKDITKFCEISQETHRIYSSPKFARLQGYRGIPIPISFHLCIILDTLGSFIPQSMTCRGIDYLVVNPLTAGSHIRIYRHWMSNDDEMAASLAELAQRTAPAILNTPVDKRVSESIFRRKQLRQKKITRRALFWTESGDGQVGIVVFAILVTDSPSRWPYQVGKGFISPKIGLDEAMLRESMKRDSNINLELDKDYSVNGGFDPLGRPIKSDVTESRETNVRDSWSARDSIARSRNLLHRLFTGDDDDIL